MTVIALTFVALALGFLVTTVVTSKRKAKALAEDVAPYDHIAIAKARGGARPLPATPETCPSCGGPVEEIAGTVYCVDGTRFVPHVGLRSLPACGWRGAREKYGVEWV